MHSEFAHFTPVRETLCTVEKSISQQTLLGSTEFCLCPGNVDDTCLRIVHFQGILLTIHLIGNCFKVSILTSNCTILGNSNVPYGVIPISKDDISHPCVSDYIGIPSCSADKHKNNLLKGYTNPTGGLQEPTAN